MTRRYWTQDEVALLKKLYAAGDTADLVAHFEGRTEKALKLKAYKLGVLTPVQKRHPPLTELQARKLLEAEGYSLLKLGNKHNSRHLHYLCPDGHEGGTTVSAWRKGRRCAACKGVKKIDPKVIEEAFASKGFTLLSAYTGSNTKLDYICPDGHQWSMIWRDWKKSQTKCAICSGKAVPPDFVKSYFEKEGYSMIGEYVNSTQKIDYICPSGHKGSISWNAFKSGNRCWHCSIHPPVSNDYVAKSFQEEGYILLDEYIDSASKLRFICPSGHQHKISWNSWRKGRRCGKCRGYHRSDSEKKLWETRHAIAHLVNVQVRRLIKNPVLARGNDDFIGRIAHQVHIKLGPRPLGAHLDHLTPQSFFDVRNKPELEACWDINNLRWLPARQNMAKNNRMSQELLESLSDAQLKILAKASLRPLKYDYFLFKRGYTKKMRTLPAEIQLNLMIS